MYLHSMQQLYFYSSSSSVSVENESSEEASSSSTSSPPKLAFETFASFGMSKKKKYYEEKVELDISFDGYFPPNQDDGRDSFEFENRFKVSWKLTERIRIYNSSEVSKLQTKEFYKRKTAF